MYHVFSFVDELDLPTLFLVNQFFASIACSIHVLRCGITPGQITNIEGNSFRALGSWRRSRFFAAVHQCVLICHIDEENFEIAKAQLECLHTFLSTPFHGAPLSIISIHGIALQLGDLLQFIRLIDRAGCRRASISIAIDDTHAFHPALKPALDSLTLSNLDSLEIQNSCIGDKEWSTLLNCITVPNLQDLSLRGNFTSISLARFLLRHPHVKEIQSNASWMHTDCMQFSAMPTKFLGMPELQSIDGPPCHIRALLKSLLDVPNALEVSIAPEPRMTYNEYIINVLDIARLCNPSNKFQIQIPTRYHQNCRTALTETQTQALRDGNTSQLCTVQFIIPPISEEDLLVCCFFLKISLDADLSFISRLSARNGYVL